MSILVSDGTSVATDTFGNAENISFPLVKLIKEPSTGSVAGAIGPLPQVPLLLKWFITGLQPEQFPKGIAGTGAQLVVVSKDKGTVRYNGTPVPILHGFNTIAIGEGAPFAYGALYAGATLEQAVEAAILYSPHCNGKVEVLKCE